MFASLLQAWGTLPASAMRRNIGDAVSSIGAAVILVACSGPTPAVPQGSDSGASGGGSPADGATPTTIVSGLSSDAVALASDGVTLFLIEAGAGNLMSVPANGGATTLLQSDVSRTFLAVDAVNLYYLKAGAVFRMMKSGGSPIAMSDGSGPVDAAALRGETVFWTEAVAGAPYTVAIKSAEIHGGAPSFVENLMASPSAMAATNRQILVKSVGPLLGVVLDGGALQLISGAGDCVSLIADDDTGYCLPGAGALGRIANDESVTNLVRIYDGNPSAQNLAVDANDVYLLNNPATGSTVARIPKSGGIATVLAREPASAVAVDDAAIYWATSDGQIRRLAK